VYKNDLCAVPQRREQDILRTQWGLRVRSTSNCHEEFGPSGQLFLIAQLQIVLFYSLYFFLFFFLVR
jgi:hypothetical protein